MPDASRQLEAMPAADGRLHPRFRRALALGLVVGAHALAFWFLLRPTLIELPTAAEALILVDIPAPPPPPPIPEAPPEPEGQSAPEAPKAKPRPVAAPPPDVVVPPPEPSPTPPAPAEGPDTASGAANVDRGGTAAGGEGIGSGLGRGGAGTGGGGATRAHRVAGNILRSDYPRARNPREVGGSVTAHFDVGVDGRARNCRVVRSSGNPERDAITCRLIEQRFRYEPARDPRGNPVPDVAGWRQDWWPDG